jgi:hypothetical protein
MACRSSKWVGPVVGPVLLVQFINRDGYDAWYAEFRVKGESKYRRIKVEDDAECVWEAVVEVSSRLKVARSRIDLLRANLEAPRVILVACLKR